MMSDADPSASAPMPRWMPIGEEPELCAAGQWWDAIRAVEAIGLRAMDILTDVGEPMGPVILAPEGPEPRLYFLVPAGAAADWEEPGTVALGLKCHVIVPPAGKTEPPGLYWHRLPSSPRALTQPAALRRALSKARRERRGSAEDPAS
ncbi:hypothetical protein M2271_002180 [Streptomyces sp. LBL]|nr:hypothetical protein [Streptomyces sp. LBL]